MNRLHAFAGLVAALLAFSAGTAAAGQLYKWVDEHGRVNYSNQLPADPNAARKVANVEDRVSVYTPDPALVREIAANRQRIKDAAYERPAVVQPPAVAMLGTSSPLPTTMYESYGSDYPYYWVAGGHKPHRPRPLSSIPQIKLQPGAIAGTIVGMNGLIPGSTAPVPGTWSPATPQPPQDRPHGPSTRPSWRR